MEKSKWTKEYKREYAKAYRIKNKEYFAKYMSIYYKNNPEKRTKTTAEQLRRYYKKNPEKIGALNKAYKKRNPEKGKIHKQVWKLVKKGLITRGVCFCGETKTEGHHTDYNKPLELMWLCRKHHVEWHRNNKAIPIKKMALKV